MEDLEKRICEVIIKRCRLSDINVDDVDFDAPLFFSDDEENVAQGLELDSVDALEIVAGIKGEFNVTINAKDRAVFKSINTLAEYVRKEIDN